MAYLFRSCRFSPEVDWSVQVHWRMKIYPRLQSFRRPEFSKLVRCCIWSRSYEPFRDGFPSNWTLSARPALMQYASNEYTRLTPTWQWFRQAIGLWISEREHATLLRSTPRQWLHTFWIETDSTPGFTSSNWKLEQDKLSAYVSSTYITRQRVLTFILTWKYTYIPTVLQR
jgi:hypothetical protein